MADPLVRQRLKPDVGDRATRRWILAATILGSSMTFIDGTAVNVVLPLLGRELDAGSSQVQWIVEAYLLLLTSLMLLGGAMGDRYGRRRLFIAGTVLFALASAGCAAATDVWTLVGARAVQGVGAALLVPGSLAIISACFDDHQRGAAIGIWAAGTSIAAGAGPPLGSFLAQHFSWRWVFLLNLPLAACAVWIAVRHLPRLSSVTRAPRLDWVGSALATGGLGALVFGLVRAGSEGVRDAGVAASLAGGLAMLLAFAVVEWRLERAHGSDGAIVPPSMFSSQSFAAANLLTVFVYAGLSMIMFVLPFTLIERHGYSVVGASMAMVPFVIVMFALSRWAGTLLDRYGPRLPLLIGPLVASAGFLLLARVGDDGRYSVAVLPAVVVMSVGMAITVAPLTTTVMTSVDARRAGVASGINNAISRLASLLAVGIVGLISPGSFASAIERAAVLSAALAAAGAAGCALLLRRAGTVTGR
jgi:EmrB/QacA subfamily drug resistance transporter